MDGEIELEPNDRQVDFEFRNNAWEVVSQDMAETGNWDIADNGSVAANGAYIEGSVEIDLLGISDEFLFSGRTMLGQSPYDKYDKFNLFGTVKISE